MAKLRLDVAMTEQGLAESRQKAQAIIMAGQVFVNGLAAQKADAPLQVGELVSVRGKGRFRYEGPVRQTRSGRLRVSVRIY